MEKADQIDALADRFYDIGGDLSGWTGVLSALSSAFDAIGCDLHIIRDHGYFMSFMGGTPPDVLDEYISCYLHREPRSRFLASGRQGTVATDLQFTTREYMRGSAYYSDFLVRAGLGQCIAALPLQTPARSVYLGVHFSRAVGPPQHEKLRLVQRLLPHVNRAVRAQFHLLDACLQNTLYSEALDKLDIGVVILSMRQTVMVENAKAAQILRDGRALQYACGRLTATVPDEASQLRNMIDSAVERSGDRGGHALFRGRGDGAVSVTVVPASERFRAHTGAAALIFAVAIDQSRCVDRSAALRRIYGLTTAEARIASLLACGYSARELADVAGVTYETARTTIKRVFTKCGVKRQGELVALLHVALPDAIATSIDPRAAG